MTQTVQAQADAGAAAAGVTLQAAYNAAPTAPQIAVNATPEPVAIMATVAGPVLQIQDTLGANIFEVDDTFVEVDGQLRIVDAFTNHAALTSMTLEDTFTTGAGFLGGGILSNGTVTYDNSFFIWALLQESKVYRAAAGPGFAAFTLFNALAVIENLGNFDLVQALILNNGVSHRRTSAGTSTVTQTVGLSNSPNTRTNVAGAIMTKTAGDTGVRHGPTFSTVAGSTVNMGVQRGLHVVTPAVALFQPSAGVENATALLGVDVENMAFGGNIVKRALRSFIPAATNALFLDNQGGAASDFGAGGIHLDDNTPVQYGGAAFNSQDVSVLWSTASSALQQFFANNADSLLWSGPSADRFLLTSNDPAAGQINMDFLKGSFGQAGAVGNQKFVWAAKAETITIGGEFSQYLLTQAANDTIDAALGGYFGWTINMPTPVLGTGSLSTLAAMNIGGNGSAATVNRVGLRILSNPAGGSGINAALWITAGLSRFDGVVDINAPIALGGGAAATLGTIGGAGPTAAAQAQWVQIDINGVNHWIPAWT